MLLIGKHVVFGETVSGLEVVDALEAIGTEDGSPKKVAVIVDCGQMWKRIDFKCFFFLFKIKYIIINDYDYLNYKIS